MACVGSGKIPACTPFPWRWLQVFLVVVACLDASPGASFSLRATLQILVVCFLGIFCTWCALGLPHWFICTTARCISCAPLTLTFIMLDDVLVVLWTPVVHSSEQDVGWAYRNVVVFWFVLNCNWPRVDYGHDFEEDCFKHAVFKLSGLLKRVRESMP